MSDRKRPEVWTAEEIAAQFSEVRRQALQGNLRSEAARRDRGGLNDSADMAESRERERASAEASPDADVFREYREELDREVQEATAAGHNHVAQARMDQRSAVCEVERRIKSRRERDQSGASSPGSSERTVGPDANRSTVGGPDAHQNLAARPSQGRENGGSGIPRDAGSSPAPGFKPPTDPNACANCGGNIHIRGERFCSVCAPKATPTPSVTARYCTMCAKATHDVTVYWNGPGITAPICSPACEAKLVRAWDYLVSLDAQPTQGVVCGVDYGEIHGPCVRPLHHEGPHGSAFVEGVVKLNREVRAADSSGKTKVPEWHLTEKSWTPADSVIATSIATDMGFDPDEADEVDDANIAHIARAIAQVRRETAAGIAGWLRSLAGRRYGPGDGWESLADEIEAIAALKGGAT